jgi:CRP-like cAMP-binding protein
VLAIALNPGLVSAMSSPSAFIAMLQEKGASDGLWQVERSEKGTALLCQGAPCDQILVLTGGLVKLTYLTQAGDEWIKSFIMDAGLFGAVAIETCDMVRLPSLWVKRVVASDPAMAEQSVKFSQWLLARKQQREEALLCDPVEVRYRRMRDEEAALLARLSQGDIARYLRVTPIAFSRIKRRLRTEGYPAD